MKKRILLILSAFLIFVMGIVKYPLFSFANYSYGSGSFSYNYKIGNNTYTLSRTFLYSNNPIYAFVTFVDGVYKVCTFSFGNPDPNMSRWTSSNTSDSNYPYEVAYPFSLYKQDIYYHLSTPTNNPFGFSLPIHNVPYSVVLDSFLNNDSLGYLKNVGYHVDAYGLENNLAGTNEMVSWDAQSTTGIDLTQNKYSVEFALKDTSVEYRRTLSNEPWLPILPYGLNEPFKVMEDALGYLASGVGEIFKRGNATSAILRGEAVPTTTYGMISSIGSTRANNRRYSFNAINTYKNNAVYTSDNLFKQWIDSTYGNANTRPNFWQNVGDWINSKQLNFNLSYDIMARIVDTSNGNKGDWLLIEKHNTPYVMSDREDRLNGGVTCVTGVRIPSYDPQPDFTLPPPDEPSYNPDPENPDSKPIYLPTPVNTGYYTVDNSTGDTNVTNNYYNTTYVYDQRQYIENNVVNNDYENMREGFDLARLLPNFLGLYLRFFGAFLPGWAAAAVSILLPITISLIVIRAIKGVIPFV